MRVDTDDLATLLKMQHIDLDIMRSSKKLQQLPQRTAILEARTKKRGIEDNRDPLAALHAEADARLARISEEDGLLVEKQRRVQEEIDASHGGYRDVEARSKELNGLAKRRNTLEGELSAVSDELSKIEGVQVQVAKMMSDLDKQEAQATESFVREGGALKQDLARLETERAHLSASLPEDLAALYEKTAARTGGVAVGRLQGGSCGVCRMAIEGGRLIDMKAKGNVAPCPQCGRLLIIE